MSNRSGRQATTRDIPPIHPGEHLAEYLEEFGVSQYRLAKAVHVPQMRISEVVRGKRAITADTALRLARFFGTSPQFWLNLQSRYDLETAEESLGAELGEIGQYQPATENDGNGLNVR
jgi:addiction module HigA family antidote